MPVLGETLVVMEEDQPLAQVANLARLPEGAAVDASGRYVMTDPSSGPEVLKDIGIRGSVEQ